MTKAKRRAPDPEWVQMYRMGIPSPKIAAGAGAAESSVRYHLHLAGQAEPGLREAHKKALGAVTRITSAGLRNLNATIAFYQAEGRLPTTGGKTARERALGSWLHTRRQNAAAGTLSPVYREGLAVIPGWDSVTTRSADNAARWDRRRAELVEYLTAGNDWPRHKDFATEQERVLGVWVHVQRISRRQGTLIPEREAQLNASLPGWRDGRARSGGRRRGSSQDQ
ncbi:helicase associated domain-containing protein [Pseudarthrobacter sp. B907]|uniref:helicase associated domain-containing protein n=1 Tax=Pseudarthrobacter sp. B907 TaxID=3158261 RepID=UPI0032DB3143